MQETRDRIRQMNRLPVQPYAVVGSLALAENPSAVQQMSLDNRPRRKAAFGVGAQPEPMENTRKESREAFFDSYTDRPARERMNDYEKKKRYSANRASENVVYGEGPMSVPQNRERTERKPAYRTADHSQAVREKVAKRAEKRRRARAFRRFVKRSGLILLITVFFAALFFVLYRQSIVEQNIVDIATVRSQLDEETKQNSDLQLTLAEKYDIATIRASALEKLKLIYPQKEQTVRVPLPDAGE